MLRKLLDYALSLTEKGKPLHRVAPLVRAGDTFLYEAPIRTNFYPHVRDAVDLKRWMSIVVLALLPCILMAIWNTGVQKLVFSSGDYRLMEDFLKASTRFSKYQAFVLEDQRYLEILRLGSLAFFPVMIISYAVGGMVEALFAIVRRHEIAEGFLVTGMLYPLVLPPTIPYWMVAFGVAFGVVISKELFGGTGMNIMNPALTCRALLFFAFPMRMSGDVWVGTNPVTIRNSLIQMNADSSRPAWDAYSQASPLAIYNVGDNIHMSHIDAIAANSIGSKVGLWERLKDQFSIWQQSHPDALFANLNADQLKSFVTDPIVDGGLGLAPESFTDAFQLAGLKYGIGAFADWNYLFGNQLGCFGETSAIACLIGAAILIFTKIGSWRTMLGFLLGAVTTAGLFQLGANYISDPMWNPARYGFPFYKHLYIGGMAFGLVYMATDPVSSPGFSRSKLIYGFFIGMIAILIRAINPAYPEGVMLAILLGNVFAPLIDHYVIHHFRRRHFVKFKSVKA